MIKKASDIFSKLILLGMIFYGLYFLISLFNQSQTIKSFIENVLNYSLVKNNEANITIGKLILEIFLLIVSFYLAKLFSKKIVTKILNRTNLDLGAKESILRLSQYIFLFILIGLSLSLTQIPLTAFAFVGGALAIGAGFGSQNMINNFISGIIIQVEKPIKVGDTVQIDTSTGKVTEIGVRSTKIRLSNKTYLIVPNSFFLEKNITNWHFADDAIRSKISLEVDLAQDYKNLKTLLENNLKEILINKEININLIDIKTTGYLIELSFDVNMDTEDKSKIESLCREKIINLHNSKQIILSNKIL